MRDNSAVPQTILVVDDSATIRSIVKIYLMGFHCDFVDADSGERALQLANLTRPDLVIADVKMPGISGVDFVRAIRSHQDARLRNTPIVLLTGEKLESIREEGLSAGANAFVQKPVTAETLKTVVEPLLKKDA